jgi:hypothetical protein
MVGEQLNVLKALDGARTQWCHFMAIVIAGDCDRRALVMRKMQKATMIAMKWYYCVLAPSSALRADATREPRACYVAVSLHCAVQFVPFGYISSTMTLFRYIYLHSSTET